MSTHWSAGVARVKSVRFNEHVTTHVFSSEDGEERRGFWHVDGSRFRNRVAQIETALAPLLLRRHAQSQLGTTTGDRFKDDDPERELSPAQPLQ